MKTRFYRRTGFTLLEILIATGILAIGLVTVFALFPIGIYAVRETVNNSRGAALAAGARSELAAARADMRIRDAGSQDYDVPSIPSGFVPFGPWRFPGDVAVFRNPLREYIPLAGALVRAVVFDDRRHVGITLTTVNNGFDGTNVVRVRGSDLDRDSDRLEYLYNPAAAGPNMYEPYEILLRLRGVVYQILDRTYTAVLPSGELSTLTLAVNAPNIPGEVPFEILLPVAMKEPPMEVPLEWLGGIAEYSVSQYDCDSRFENRNLAMHMCEPGADPGGWISIGGDWFQLNTVNRNAQGMPTSFTVLAPAPPVGGPTDEFNILLPVVAFSATVDAAAGTETLNVISTGNAVGGGGPQLGFLESGAYVEVVFDGAWGTFDLTNAGGHTVALDAATVNATTSPFLMKGNFIRVAGRDYEIDSVDLGAGTLTTVDTVPQLGYRYFNIVFGYITGGTPVPGVARFPVRDVTRVQTASPAPVPFPVTYFDVGGDANGNLPDDFFVAAGVGVPPSFSSPVRVLPRNFSQFSYEVVATQKSLSGDFTAASSQVDGPSWPAAADTPAIGPIPYPPSLDPNVATFSAQPIYQMRLLTLPASTGAYWPFGIASVALDYSNLQIGGSSPFSATRLPFHVYDRNDFTADMLAGTGTYAPGPPDIITFSGGGSVTPDAIFLAPSVNVELSDGVNVQQTTVWSVSPDLNSIVIVPPPGPLNPGSVTVTITGRAAGLAETPRGRGRFVQGSNIVVAVYPDQLSDMTSPWPTPPPAFAPLSGGTNWRGFPYSTAAAARHQLAVGDYIQGRDAAGNLAWYAVKAINDTSGLDPTTTYDYLVLDRAYEGPTNSDAFFRYETPIDENYDAQVAVFRNYRITALRDVNGSRAVAAAFGFDDTGTRDAAGAEVHVHLAAPLPPAFKPGDYIRADGDADHPSGTATDLGLADTIDGNWRWYMIDAVSPDRRLLTLTSPYRGYVPANQTFQPASATNGIIRTFDTILGAF